MTSKKQWLSVVCGGLILAAGLSGCYRHPEMSGGGTPFRFNMWQLHQYDYLVHQLRLRGVQVVRVGDKTRLILSTDNFFKINSTELEPGAHATVHWVANLLHHCGCPKITITGHVDNVFNDSRRKTLANEQARIVAAELWANGIPRESMVVSGKSNEQQVATDRTVFGSGDNRRIEIRLD